MNKVLLTGKIIRINRRDKVDFITIKCQTGKEVEFVPVTIIENQFFRKYFYPEKWICVEGHFHVSKYNDEYRSEIIADKIEFSSEANEDDKRITETYKKFEEMRGA